MSIDTKIQDQRIQQYIEIAERLRNQDFNGIDVPIGPPDQVGQLGLALQELANALKSRYQRSRKIDRLAEDINAGLLLDDILERVYDEFRGFIPYERIGFALVEDDGQTVRAVWNKSDLPKTYLKAGYSASLEGSSLKEIIDTGRPRIINDLEAYLENKPESKSTSLIVKEGFRSSLTCPLIINGVPVGFIFFSSQHPNIYLGEHINTFLRIAGHLSVIVEKGRLTTELMQQKDEIEERNQALSELNALKNAFLGMAAHDMRSPLSIIKMVMHFLLDPDEDVSDEQHLALIKEVETQTDYMLTLINDLLDVTQIESGTLDLNFEPIDLDSFLAGIVARHEQLAAPKGTHIVLEPVNNGVITFDKVRIGQVMDNLISNAVKYSPPGSTVWVRADSVEEGWRISVRDEGPGLSKDDRQHLFRYFQKLSPRPTGGEKSTGLGLAISRRIVEAHGGQIGCDTELDQGATFWFILPVVPPETTQGEMK
jgi:signal transduction histidine kinase